MIFKIINGKAVRYDSGGGITKIDDISVDFSQAESRENIAPTDTMKIILGKIMKWFSDLSAGAASSLLGQNLTAGKVLVSDDGGKVAASVVDASKVGFLNGVTGDLQEQINSLNSAINFSLYRTTINLSTNAYGNISLNKLDKDRKLWLLSAFCNNYIVLPYKINDYWECKIVSMNDGSKITPVVSTGVIVQCFWLEVN